MLLYYITDRQGFAGTAPERRAALLRRIAAAARAAVDFIQLREKDLATDEIEQLAREAVTTVHENSASTKLLINTRADIALAVGADGVHLPSGSPPVSEVRIRWLRHTSREPVIGVSAHSVEDLRRPESQGADFAVLAPIFEKVGTVVARLGLEVLREACNEARIPVLALGGVNVANVRDCLAAGAAGIAGIRLFQDSDISGTVTTLREFARQNPHTPN